MAPEVKAKKEYNRSADIYSLGVIFTQLFVGHEKVKIPDNL